MPVRPTGEGNHIRMPLSAGGFFSNLFSLDLCMAYREVAHPEKRPTPAFRRNRFLMAKTSCMMQRLDDLPVQRLRKPAYERIR